MIALRLEITPKLAPAFELIKLSDKNPVTGLAFTPDPVVVVDDDIVDEDPTPERVRSESKLIGVAVIVVITGDEVVVISGEEVVEIVEVVIGVEEIVVVVEDEEPEDEPVLMTPDPSALFCNLILTNSLGFPSMSLLRVSLPLKSASTSTSCLTLILLASVATMVPLNRPSVFLIPLYEILLVLELMKNPSGKLRRE